MAAVELDELEPGAWLDDLTTIWKRDDTLTAEAVVAEAKNPASALHPYFEWDDTTAAERWRLDQASRLIRRGQVLLTVEGGETVKLRAFLNVSGKGYQPTAKVLSNASMREDVLGRMRADIQVMTARYERYADIPKVGELIKGLRRCLKEHGG